MKVSGKTIAVTGGGNGIGRQLVLGLLARGARVAAIDMSEAALQETVSIAAAGDKLSTHIANITDRTAVEALPEATISAHGQVDGLINCAGIIQPFVKLNELEYDAIDRVMNVNFFGTLYMTKAFLPYLLKRPAAHIVNVSSMGGFLPVPGQTIYGASKAAVKLLTEGLNSELTETNVRVTVVFPGAIHTDISVHSGIQAAGDAKQAAEQSKIKMTEPSVAAALMLDGVESDAYRVLVGPDAKAMDRLSRLSPKFAAGVIYKNMRSLLG